MNDPLRPCSSCHRHIHEGACPFCEAPSRPASAASGAAILAVGAALLSGVAAPMDAMAQGPRELLGQAPATGYGAPPSPEPLDPPPDRPVEQAEEGRVRVQEFELWGRYPVAVLTRTLRSRHPALRRCLALARGEGDPSLRATVVVSERGSVSRVHADGGGAQLRRCAMSALRALRLPPSGETMTLRFEGRPIGQNPLVSSCRGPSPAGCRATGCGANQVCVTAGACVPSSCACGSGGHWTCTSDCGGGRCVPAPSLRR